MLAATAAGPHPARAEQPPRPAQRLPLAAMGFPGHTIPLVHAGFAMSTVHWLDASHILFTYSMRGLVAREGDDDRNDQDREVAAVLLDLPSGKVLARAQWHLHDHGPYLWDVGQGVFALRIRDSLSLMKPLEGLARGNAFERTALGSGPGVPLVVTGSPDGRVVTVESLQETKEPLPEGAIGEPRVHRHVTVRFYRLTPPAPGAPLQVHVAGTVGAAGFIRLALDGDGYMWADEHRRGRWELHFNEFGGKAQVLTAVNSSCAPHLNLLSRSEFLVGSCRGTDDQQTLAAYGFDGHENWEEPLGQTLEFPQLVPAPAAGRFAMSRLTPIAMAQGIPQDPGTDTLAQEIRVYQNGSGDLLLHLFCTPATRAAQNFDLSGDGMRLAVIGRDTLDIYQLPSLSDRDRRDLAEAASMLPPESQGAVDLRAIAHVAQPAEDTAEGGAPPSGGTPALPASTASAPSRPAPAAAAGSPAKPSLAATAPSAASSQPASSQAAAQAPARPSSAQASATDSSGAQGEPAGDAPAAARKPPTLLNPGEAAAYKPKPQ